MTKSRQKESQFFLFFCVSVVKNYDGPRRCVNKFRRRFDPRWPEMKFKWNELVLFHSSIVKRQRKNRRISSRRKVEKSPKGNHLIHEREEKLTGNPVLKCAWFSGKLNLRSLSASVSVALTWNFSLREKKECCCCCRGRKTRLIKFIYIIH